MRLCVFARVNLGCFSRQDAKCLVPPKHDVPAKDCDLPWAIRAADFDQAPRCVCEPCCSLKSKRRTSADDTDDADEYGASQRAINRGSVSSASSVDSSPTAAGSSISFAALLCREDSTGENGENRDFPLNLSLFSPLASVQLFSLVPAKVVPGRRWILFSGSIFSEWITRSPPPWRVGRRSPVRHG